ncbi:NTF2-like protein [Auriculariales sp. MPI-PUGE-AT-0066]|nr:NTF2-like protein [Auriculariales sp. MPI-PUGE-AT-0066]
MAPTATTSRPARHAFSKAVRGVVDQATGGDEQMNDAASKTGPVRSLPRARKHGRPDKDKDKMQGVERAARANTLAARLGPSRLSVTGRPSAATAKSSVRSPPHEMWREFVNARYNPAARFLDLSRIANDPIVRRHGLVAPGLPGTSSRTGAVIFKLASQLKPAPVTVTLANNNLRSTTDFLTLSHFLPAIRNLSLEGNSLRYFKDIEPFASRKGRLTQLRELILAGNPLRDNEFAAGKGEQFTNEITRRFPSLEMLDGVHIVKLITFDENDPSSSTGANIPAATQFPVPMQAGSVPAEVSGLIGEFCTRFFDCFDNSRGALASIYAPDAVFSFSVNSGIPPRAKVQSWHRHPSMPNQRKLEWSKWFEAGSRNLTRISSDKAEEHLYTGTEAIGRGLAKIPGTKHDLSHPEHFIVDVKPIPSGPGGMLLIAVVHGQFTEVKSQGIRSAAGSPAQLAGWPVHILNDIWVIRNFSHPEVWTPGARLASAVPANAFTQQQPNVFVALPPQQTTPEAILAVLPQDQQEILAKLPDVQRGLVLALCARTGLGVMFAGQCLEGNQWNLGSALANFESVRAQLPAEAYLAR